MQTEMTRDTIQGLVAIHSKLAAMDGYLFDKKAKRYSAMADYVEHIVACGESVSPRDVIAEAVSTAIIGDSMYIEKTPFIRDAYLWMEIK